jgi:hypothetical protein
LPRGPCGLGGLRRHRLPCGDFSFGPTAQLDFAPLRCASLGQAQ